MRGRPRRMRCPQERNGMVSYGCQVDYLSVNEIANTPTFGRQTTRHGCTPHHQVVPTLPHCNEV